MVGEAAVEETEQVQFYQLEITHIYRQMHLIGPMKFLIALLDFLSFFVFYPQTVQAIRGANWKSNKTTRA